MKVEIIINVHSDKPIFEQIYLQVKKQITSGQMKSGEELPSIRKFASELQVSAITTKNAYELLNLEGYTISRPGKGMYVNDVGTLFLKEKGQEEVKMKLRELIEIAKSESILKDEFQEMVNEFYEEEIE